LTTHLCCSDLTWEFSDGLALHKLDLQTGVISEILTLPGRESLTVDQLQQISNAFAFSPDDSGLIYSSPGEKSVFHFKILKTNEERVFNLGHNYAGIGEYEWSPDGRKVVFVGMTENYVRDGFSLFLFKPAEGLITTVLDHDARLLVPYEWKNQNDVTLFSFYLDQPHYDINIASGLVKISATPLPTP
jgi:Tol biopolymer transport system component